MPPVNVCEEIHAPCNDQLRVGGCHGKIRETSKKRTLDAMQSDGHMTSRKTVEDTPGRTSSEDEQQRRDNPTAVHVDTGLPPMIPTKIPAKASIAAKESTTKRQSEKNSTAKVVGVEARPRESLKPPVATKKAKLGKVKTAKKVAAKPEQERRRKRKAKDSSASAGISQASAKCFQCSCQLLRTQAMEYDVRAREMEERNAVQAKEVEEWERRICSLQRELEEYADEQPPSETASMSVVEAGPAALRASGEQVNPLSAMANAAMLGATAAVESSLPPTVVAAEAKLQEERASGRRRSVSIPLRHPRMSVRNRHQHRNGLAQEPSCFLCIQQLRSASSAGRGGRRPPGEPAEQDIARSIQQSAVRVRVALQLGDVQDEMEPLRGLLMAFERQFEARRGVEVTRHYHVRVDLLECGLNSWQNLVELQRVLAGLTRPMEDREEQQLMVKTMLRHDPKYDEWTLSLGFARASEDALWRCASSLMLRLKSCGVPSKVLLPTHRVVVRLASAFVEWGNSEIDNYRWEGKHVWTQLVVEVPGEERDEIQRVFLPPVGEVATDTLAQLRYPELAPVVYDMLSSKTDVGKPVVVILRGIPGSGKSTLGREIEAICRYRGAAFTACSADLFFETPRGYVFDVRKLGAAHSKCKGDFTKAVQGGIPRIMAVAAITSTLFWSTIPAPRDGNMNRTRISPGLTGAVFISWK
ncbi:P-loop containing nucleoside triphosphate hydrolase [Phytophthora cactorum]|nr:P-loop containing nucleoside triphosphate hydrolase [Phytophthora cactorum]